MSLVGCGRIDIFVLPSLSEALSNALMEEMACRCAVAASQVGGNPELVSDGTTGLLFEAGNASELANRLEHFIFEEDLRIRIGKRAGALLAGGIRAENG
jgi:glycosyltransferase involved in cell wall biosynthesis